MSSPQVFKSLQPAICLSQHGLEMAVECYKQEGDGAAPSVLCVPHVLLTEAYKILGNHPIYRSLLVVPLPGLASYDWFVAGTRGIVWSSP